MSPDSEKGKNMEWQEYGGNIVPSSLQLGQQAPFCTHTGKRRLFPKVPPSLFFFIGLIYAATVRAKEKPSRRLQPTRGF